MRDVAFLLVVIVFFLASWGLVEVFDRLRS
jgi:hypothetical protein